MKLRLTALAVAAALCLVGCAPDLAQVDGTTQLYASFFPIYALSSLVLEDVPGVGLKCLVQPQDDCLRLYDISDWDASVLAYDADCVIIGGRGLESFESSLYTFGNEGPAVITAMYSLDLYNEDGNASIEGGAGHLSDANPYLYMSVDGAQQMVMQTADALIDFMPNKAAAIRHNSAKAAERLTELKAEMLSICSAAYGQQVILMNEALIYTALELGMLPAYRYDRESGTTLYGSMLDDAVKAFRQSGAEVVLIEKQAPTELVYALEDAGFSVVLIDIMSSYSATDNGEAYFEKQLANARAIASVFEK